MLRLNAIYINIVSCKIWFVEILNFFAKIKNYIVTSQIKVPTQIYATKNNVYAAVC